MPTTNIDITVSGVGESILNAADPSAVTWIRVNADNTITYRTASETLADIGAENALTFSTGLTRTVNTITIDGTVVTLTGSQALSNKTGLISQWTNDSGYLTSLSGAVTSVSGTANRISSTGGATPVIDIDAAYVGQTSITTLGTIATGSIPFSLITGTVGISQGGTNLTALGTGLQQLRVNAGATALEYFTPASAGITIGDAISGGTANRFLFEDASNLLGENNTDFYFEPATPFTHVIASGRTGTITGINNTIYGYQAGKVATTATNCTYVGYQAGLNNTSNESVGIGASALDGTASFRSTAVGYLALSASAGIGYSVGIGRSAGQSATGSHSVYIGYTAGQTISTGARNIAIGAGAMSSVGQLATAAACIAIGYNAATTASNQGVLGANDANGYIDNWYFNGVTHSAPYAVTLNASGSSANNISGASMTLASGAGKGSGATAELIFRTPTVNATAATTQTLVSRLILSQGAVTTDVSTATWSDALNFVFGTTTGTKFGTATTQKIGFWNTTPVVQPTTGIAAATVVSGSGGVVKHDDTFDGYTLEKVVRALRNTGLLA
jgi:hypothetical protein